VCQLEKSDETEFLYTAKMVPQNTSEDSLHEKTSNDNVITNEEQKGDNLDKDGGKSTDMGDNSDTGT
jgi:hypothetical protein